MGRNIIGIAAFLMLSLSFSSQASALLAFVDHTVFIVGDGMVFKANRTANVDITGTIYNSTAGNVSWFTIPNGSAGLVEYEHVPSPSLDAGEYSVVLDQSGDDVNLTFEVVTMKLQTVVRLMGAAEPVFVDTSTEVNNDTGEWGASVANFTAILSLNLSDTIYTGTYANLSGDDRDFTFVTVDENEPGIHDRVYVDDDRKFEFYNDNEDAGAAKFLETAKKPGDMLEIDASHRFIIADIDAAGGMVYLIVPPNGSEYAPDDELYMVVLVVDQEGDVQPGQDVSIEIRDEEKTLLDSDYVSIGSNGYANISFNLTGYLSGKYFILANGTPVDVFKVESFSLHGKVTDLDGNVMTNFAPGSEAKAWVVSRDGDGNLQELDAPPEGSMILPDGTEQELVFEEVPNATGVYTAEVPASSDAGEYKIVIEGEMSSEADKVEMGMNVKALDMVMMTINPRYMDEGPGESSTVDTFVPGGNVTAAVFMLNNSAGSGFMSGGPPCGFDGGSCVATTCSASQFKVTVKSEKGQKYKLQAGANYTVMTIAEASQSFGLSPPEEVGIPEQCMILIYGNNSWSNTTGNYKLEAEFSNASLGDFKTGQSFGIQRLLATGATVDFKGDSFSFFAPNSTVRVKIEIRNMVTDELLSASEILEARFTSMWKEWPSRENALDEAAMNFSKALLNESMDDDKIVFTSPPDEGFYSAEFRFVANVSGERVDGTGRIFFELKKYMIWAQFEGEGMGGGFVRPDSDVSLVVNIMDIDMGSMYGQEGVTQSCTNCEGLIATVGSLRNEEFFKEMTEGTDYNVTTGVVINSTSGATVTITSDGNLPSGWYGVDILLQDPETGDEYYGWGGFEVRNFWVDVFEVETIDGQNYTEVGGEEGGGGDNEGSTMEAGGSMLFGIAAYQPSGGMGPESEVSVDDVVLRGMENDMVWPPVPISGSYYTFEEIGEVEFIECNGEYCETSDLYVINLSLDDSIPESSYRLSMDVQTPIGGDLGMAWVTVSTYVVEKTTIPESKMYEFPPVYGNTESMTLLFNATDFDGNPHNITNVTISDLFSEKAGRPLKFRFGQNYTNNCQGDTSACNLTVFMANLEPGMYGMRLEIVDDTESRQSDEFGFEVRNLLFAVPRMYEGWVGQYATAEQTLNAWYAEDSCQNEMNMEGDNCQGTAGTLCTGRLIGDLTVPQKGSGEDFRWGRWCIATGNGAWMYGMNDDSPDCPPGFVYTLANGTYMWFTNTTDFTGATMLEENDTFEAPGYQGLTWELTYLGGSGPQEISHMQVKLHDAICGRSQDGGDQGDLYQVVPPAQHVNHTTYYHGPATLVGDMYQTFEERCQEQWAQNDFRCLLNATNREVYIYHNTTHLWVYPSLSGVINFTDGGTYGPYSVGQMFEDTSGGLWEITTISKGVVDIVGHNILSDGIAVNVSLSVSGRIYIGELREREIGQQNKMAGNTNNGLDLDGDGYTNSTFYFLVLDSVTGYDKLAYAPDLSQKWNFSALVDMNDVDRSARLVGNADHLTLLSIDPRATRAKFYDSNALGDWPELGDAKIGANVTIPVIVRTPGGANITANVTINTIKRKTDERTEFVQLSPPIRIVVTDGVGEIRVNVSAINDMGSGRYEFGLSASNNTLGTETLNEWMWPRVVVRNFLVDGSAGYGGLVSNFTTMSLTTYGGWGSDVMIQSLEGRGGRNGVFAFIDHQLGPPEVAPACSNFARPAGVGNGNITYVLPNLRGVQYFVYYNESSGSRFWLRQNDCNFTAAQSYTTGQPLNLSIGSDIYMLYVLNATQGYGAIGLSDFDPAVIEPVTNSTDFDYMGWSMMSVNLSGVTYNVVFANDTNLAFPQAATWHINQPAEVAWFSTSYNFSYPGVAQRKLIGDAISGNLYLARVGPDSYSGMSIGNAENISTIIATMPAIDAKVQDGTPVYFGVIDESDPAIGNDLNLNDDVTDVFYMVAFDGFPDGQSELSNIFIDDDLNISEPWWADSNNPGNDENAVYYDYYENEFGMAEQQGGVPKGMWGGNVNFGPNNDSLNWEENRRGTSRTTTAPA